MLIVFRKILLFILVFTAFSSIYGVSAKAEQSNWWQGTPTFKKLRDITEPTLTPKYCTNTKIVVQRRSFIHPTLKDETHCMINTSYGSVNSEATVLQPVGSSKAYEIKYARGIIPVPNHPAALYRNNSTYSYGQSLSLYKNFYGSLKLTYDGTIWYYELSSAPDTYFRHTSDNRLRQFNEYETLSFSDDGHEFIVEERRSGYIKVNLTTLEITPVLTSNGVNSAGNFFSSDTALSREGLGAVAYNGGWGRPYFDIVDTKDCNVAAEDASTWGSKSPCRHRGLRNSIQDAIPGLQAIYHPRFTSERTIVFEASTSISGQVKFAEYAMTAPGKKYRELEYLAMGDSFASGQGAGNYREGTDTERNRCHQSTLSYPYLFAKYFESSASVACSGAKLNNVFSSSKTDIVDQLIGDIESTEIEKNSAKEHSLPGYVQQFEFINAKNPKNVTLSVGGNDIGFANIFGECASPMKTDHIATCFATYEDRYEIIQKVNGRIERLRGTYKEILKDDPERKLYVIGYPQIAAVDGECGVNIFLNREERRGAKDLIEYLNKIIKQAADEAGAYYVDVSDAFAGHKLCETHNSNVAVNGATLRFDQGKTIEYTESYHPNQLGHELLAQKIKEQTKTFTVSMPAPNGQETLAANIPVSVISIPFLQNVPSTGRLLRNVVTDNNGVVKPILKLTPQSAGYKAVDYLLKPSSQFIVELHSTPVQLGTFTSSVNGDLSVNYTIPNHIEAGFHTLHVYGKNVFNEDIDIQKTVFVAATEQDIDGDGISNSQDRCIGEQIAEDVDKDIIPDSCDPFIGIPSEPSVSGDAALATQQHTKHTMLAPTFLSGTAAARTELPFLPSNSDSLAQSRSQHLPHARKYSSSVGSVMWVFVSAFMVITVLIVARRLA